MDEKAGDPSRTVAREWAKWQAADFRAGHEQAGGIRDPCLSKDGARVAGSGVSEADRVRLSAIKHGYEGPRGGLRCIGENFDPELILSSPLSRALQTAHVIFDRCKAPIVVCPSLKEIKLDETKGGKYPEGRPGCQGMPRSTLQAAVDAHPRSAGGAVDLGHLTEDIWYNPNQPFDEKCKNLEDLASWLATRKERRIAIVTHGKVLKKWVQATFGHAQFAIGELYIDAPMASGCALGNTQLLLTRCSDGVQRQEQIAGDSSD